MTRAECANNDLYNNYNYNNDLSFAPADDMTSLRHRRGLGLRRCQLSHRLPAQRRELSHRLPAQRRESGTILRTFH